MPNKTIDQLKALMQGNQAKTTKGSISPADVFQTMEWFLDTMVELGVDKIDQVMRDLGVYANPTTTALTVGTSGKYLNLSGAQISDANYAMSTQINLVKGNFYLVKATSDIGANVSLFSKYEESVEEVAIDYTYTYDAKGRIATATADYNSALVYTYTYHEDEGGHEHCVITDADGHEVHYLPHTRKTAIGSYVPLFNQGSLGIPTKGYFVYLCSENMKAVISAKSADINGGQLIKVEYGAFLSIADEFATKREMKNALAKLANSVDAVAERVEDLSYGSQTYCVGEYDNSIAAPEAFKVHGSVSFANNWHFYLVDVTATPVNGKVEPVGELMRNNLFRFTNGRFAPAVAISAEQAEECSVALYLDANHSSLWSEAGAFDPEAFYNAHGVNTKLYNYDGQEVRVMRPWETTETKYFIGVARDSDIYVLDGQVGDSGKVWKGIFGQPMTWDGIDVTPFKLPPTLMPLNAVTEISGKPRGFYFSYNTNQGNCQGSKGTDNLIDWFHGPTIGRTFPVVNIGEQTQMAHCRSLNPTATDNAPWAEGGFMTLNAYVISQELVYGTNDIHKDTAFGSGISANDSCVDETSFHLHGGFRYRIKGNVSWNYAGNGSQVNIFNAGRTKYTVWPFLNNYYPIEECYESQAVASYIKERNIAAMAVGTPSSTFEFNGGTYYYNNIASFNGATPKTILEGEMNARIYRLTGIKVIDAYDAEGNATQYEVQFCKRMSLYGGVTLAGGIFIAWPGGLEIIGTCTNAASGSTGNVSDVYIQPDQTKWHGDSAASKDNLGKWAFEDDYIHVGQCTGAEGGIVSRVLMAPVASEFGGNIHTRVAGYCYNRNYWSTTLNQRVRQMKRFGGYANDSLCSPRFVFCRSSMAYTNQYLGCSAQCLLQTEALPKRSE